MRKAPRIKAATLSEQLRAELDRREMGSRDVAEALKVFPNAVYRFRQGDGSLSGKNIDRLGAMLGARLVFDTPAPRTVKNPRSKKP